MATLASHPRPPPQGMLPHLARFPQSSRTAGVLHSAVAPSAGGPASPIASSPIASLSPVSSSPTSPTSSSGIPEIGRRPDDSPTRGVDKSQIPYDYDNVHATWSEFTKKKNVRAELTRLENISWRIWHALRLRAATGRSQPRFAVRVDAATACFIDPAFALPSDDAAAAAPAAADMPMAAAAAETATSPSTASGAPLDSARWESRNRKQSLQIDPRRLSRTPTAPKQPKPAVAPGALVPTSRPSSSRPYIVITLPATLLDGIPRHSATSSESGASSSGKHSGSGMGGSTVRPAAGTRGSGAASPSGLMKRTDRQVDLARYFGVPALRMLTGASAPRLVGSASPICSTAPVMFVMGGEDTDDEDDDSDAIDFDAAATTRSAFPTLQYPRQTSSAAPPSTSTAPIGLASGSAALVSGFSSDEDEDRMEVDMPRPSLDETRTGLRF
ncbi:hypothetical protein BC828DRAFT_374205 [Blastocladiella britannica]|nr:hypothetical protein BC828DRAFT_374205 [Blastocladiella britannica]